MAGRLPSNLISMALGVASCSLSFHTLTALGGEAREIGRAGSEWDSWG